MGINEIAAVAVKKIGIAAGKTACRRSCYHDKKRHRVYFSRDV